MAHKIIAAGHLCMDITPAFSTLNRYARPGDLLEPGKVIHMNPADVRTGGSVANTGLALKKLGNDVRLMGKIGDDAFGGIVRRALQTYAAADDLIVDKTSSTSYSILLAVPGTAPFILHSPGANGTFVSADVPDEVLMDADLFHFGYPPMMRSMYQQDGLELVNLFRRAKAFGCITSLDLSSLDPDSEGGLADWPLILEQVLPYVDFFISRFVDLCWIADRARYSAIERSPSGSLTAHLDLRRDAAPLSAWALQKGCGAVLIKCGISGLYLRTGAQERTARFCEGHGLNAALWKDREILQPSFKPDSVVSSTGAGDTCIAAFLTAVLDRERPDACVSLAAAEGSCCVTTADVLSGLMTLPQLKRMILAGWETAFGRED